MLEYKQGTIENVSPDNVISFVKSRVTGILKRIGGRDNWEHLIQSGLPLQKSIELDLIFVDIVNLVIDYRLSDKTIEDKVLLLKNIETLISNQPNFNDRYIGLERIDEIREKWLKGTPLCEITPSNMVSDGLWDRWLAVSFCSRVSTSPFLMPWWVSSCFLWHWFCQGSSCRTQGERMRRIRTRRWRRSRCE